MGNEGVGGSPSDEQRKVGQLKMSAEGFVDAMVMESGLKSASLQDDVKYRVILYV